MSRAVALALLLAGLAPAACGKYGPPVRSRPAAAAEAQPGEPAAESSPPAAPTATPSPQDPAGSSEAPG